MGCETLSEIYLVILGRGTHVTAFITTVNRLKLFVTETIWKINSLSKKLMLHLAYVLLQLKEF